MNKILPLVCLLFFLAACSKKDGAAADTAVPVILINTPVNGQVVTGGSMVNITAAITDDARLAEIHVHISNNATNQQLIDIHRYPEAASYSLNESFQVQAGITYLIRVLAIDKSGKTGSGSVLVTAN